MKYFRVMFYRLPILIFWFLTTSFGVAQELQVKLDSLKKYKYYDDYLQEIWRMKSRAISANDTIGTLKATRYLLDVYTFFKKNQDSLNYHYNRGLELSGTYNKRQYRTNYQYIWANHLVNEGFYGDALKLLQDIEPVAEKGDYDFLPNLYDVYAKLHYYLGDYDLAFDKLKKEAAIFKKRGLAVNIAAVYNNLGILYKAQRQKDSSLHYHNQSLQISIDRRDTLAMVQSFNNIGKTYDTFGDNLQAVLSYEKAMKLPEKFLTASLISNYTNLLIIKGQYEKSETLLASALDWEPDKKVKKEVLKSLVKVNKIQNKFEEALAYQEAFHELSESILDETKVKEIERLKAIHSTEQKQREIRELKERNSAQKTIIRQNRILVVIVLFTLTLLVFSFILFNRNKDKKIEIDSLLMQQQLLRLQMNPHFIFNALSNIQTNILKKENNNAIKYLIRFSKLLRHNLENSNLKAIVLSNEITAIEDYLELQKMRLKESLTYVIEVEDSIETDFVKVPAMLLQPIVENAIEHGIEKVSNPIINVQIKEREDYLLCSVIDNGVGFSTTVNRKKSNKRSFATNIIKERLRILSKKNSNSFTYAIEDVFENGIIAGAKATIQLPILVN